MPYWGWSSHSACRRLEDINLSGQGLSGSLPAAWAGPQAFRNLTALSLHSNLLSGPLPAAWGGAGALPALRTLQLGSNRLTGTVPASWAKSSAFPALQRLGLAGNVALCGSVPGKLNATVCTDGQPGGNPCAANGTLPCQPLPPLPSPPTLAGDSTGGEASSVPIGAIVGGVAGGVGELS